MPAPALDAAAGAGPVVLFPVMIDTESSVPPPRSFTEVVVVGLEVAIDKSAGGGDLPIQGEDGKALSTTDESPSCFCHNACWFEDHRRGARTCLYW